MRISNLTGKCLNCVKESEVSEYLLEYNCSIALDHFDILASNSKKFKLLSKESLLIKRDQPQLNYHFISVKTFWMRTSLIDFVCVGMLLWNIGTDKRCIVVKMYQLLNIYYWLVRISNSSDDAVLVREKCQKILRKTWISRLNLYLITFDLNDLDYQDVWLTFYNWDIRVQNELKNTWAGAFLEIIITQNQ